MEQIKDIGVTLDVVLSIQAKTNAEAYEKLDRMDILKLLQLTEEQCECNGIRKRNKTLKQNNL
jgi:hypothetical protein